MKKVVLFSVLTLLVCVGNITGQIQHFSWQGVQREYIVRTPSNQTGSIPVVFFLHGLGDDITNCDQSFQFSQLAETYGWAIVVPQARNEGLGTMWNAALFNSSVDDSGFLMALLDSLTVQYNLNPDSVFFTGFSMGGFMTHRMAIEHGDRITACAPVSGLITNQMASHTPVAPVRMLHIHGTSDNMVGYNGYSSTFNMTLGLGVDDILTYWQAANGCAGEPTIDTFPDLKNDGLRFIRYAYDCSTDLQLLKVVGGSHNWYDEPNRYDIGYMDYIYNFFIGNDYPVSVSTPEKEQLQVWPNPTTGTFYIKTPDSTDISIVDAQGKTVAQHKIQPGVTSLNIQHLPDGLYFVKDQNGTLSKLVLKK